MTVLSSGAVSSGTPAAARMVVVGKIGTVHGVRGWLKLYSFTQPLDNLLEYQPWFVREAGERGQQWRPMGRYEIDTLGDGFVVRIDGCEDRDLARRYTNAEIAVPRDVLPGLPEGEFYQSDLEGLKVLTVDGLLLGCVASVLETGANDVLVVMPCEGSLDQRERLLPYVPEHYVKAVDLAAGTLILDWDPSF